MTAYQIGALAMLAIGFPVGMLLRLLANRRDRRVRG